VPGIGGSHEGVVIYDEDVARPTMSDPTRSNNSIEFSASPSLLYGYDKQTSDSLLRRLNVSASGVTLDMSKSVNLHEYGDFEVSGNLLYHSRAGSEHGHVHRGRPVHGDDRRLLLPRARGRRGRAE
jgi:hypothetical protein